jgi:hypothetical protein
MCRSAAQSESAAARSGLTLAGAADGKPAIHRCVRYRTLCLTPSESRARRPLSSSKRAGQATLTREPQRVPKAVEPLGLRQTITCGSRVASPGIIPAPAHFAQFRATCGHGWVTSIIAGPGTGCERCSFTDRGSFLLLGCAARCQTILERE